MPRQLSTNDICELFDVDQKTVLRWVNKGLPHDGGGKGKSRLFDEAEVAAWMKANKLTGKPGHQPEVGSDKLEAAKIRKELALAEKHEIAVAKEKGLLVVAAEVERRNVEKFVVIRNRLLGVPASIAPSLEGLTAPEIEEQLEARIRDVLTELSEK